MHRLVIQLQLSGNGLPSSAEVVIRNQLRARLASVGKLTSVTAGMGVIDFTLDVDEIEAGRTAVMHIIEEMRLQNSVVIEVLP